MISERFGQPLGAHDGPPLGADAPPGLTHRCCRISRVDIRCTSGDGLPGTASLAAKSCGRGLSSLRGQQAQHHGLTEAR